MIKKRATGDLDTFAKKNNLCKSALAQFIKEMKELGFPIKYDRVQNTYFYDEAGEMVNTLFVQNGKILTEEKFEQLKNTGNLCFSEISIIELC